MCLSFYFFFRSSWASFNELSICSSKASCWCLSPGDSLHDSSLVFLGDYDDRGVNDVRNLEMVLDLKRRYPKNVILISYSMIAPYLLMFFSLHLQYCSSVDMDNFMHYLLDIKRHIEKMSEILENKINTASKMISNASDEYRQIIGSIKGSISAIESQGTLEGKGLHEKK